MKYQNAKDFLDQDLFQKLQEQAGGRLLYVPTAGEKKNWGEISGERTKLRQRNQLICYEYASGRSVKELAEEWYLSVASIRKILAAGKRQQAVHYLGMDIGGTNIKYGVTDEAGALLSFDQVATPATRQEMMDALYRIIDTERKRDPQIGGIGVGCAGCVENNNVVFAMNMPLNNLPLRDRLAEYSGLPVQLDNNANCAALGEYTYANEEANLLYITIGTGVGAGVVLNGRLYRGSRGFAGEIGHTTLVFDGEPCYCGKKGCFERYASVAALVRQTKQAIRENPHSLLAALSAEHPLDGQLVFRAADEGCETAIEVLITYCRYLAAGIDSLCEMFDPHRIIISGAITDQGEKLLRPLRTALHTSAQVTVATNATHSGVIGSTRLFGAAAGRGV